ncbi:IS1380 family transposase [Alicyclobacillus sp. SO9]|uniref:IS1380 family transposase n=1 Tax=Alicyclobacillus sp. SO9 TaxID=2665646 RepID=UPI0018E6DE61|nr:IS1380 family transposase [Alicyclobacillus sp. SO9]QQE81585.1 IS1380 family transposase [Alicyclobacillus sp. SO9]
MNSVQGFTMNFNPRMRVNFDGGDLTSDAGLLLYMEFDHRIGLSDVVRSQLVVHDSASHRDHPNSDVVLQKVYQHIAGYHTDDHADDLAVEPLLTTLFGKDRLASQPTMSRFFEKADISTVKSLESVNQTLQQRVYEIEPRKQFVCDVDSSGFAAYGNQYGANFNAHYQQHGFHPLFCFDGLTGDCLGAELRAGNVYTSRQAVRFMGPILSRYEKWAPNALVVVRGDSGFADPDLFELIEAKRHKYVIRLKSNPRLQSIAQAKANSLLNPNNVHKREVYYREFMYQAASWTKARRVVVKMERPAGELLFQFTFIVTNMALQPKNVVRFYCQRGHMENFIKEAKNGLACDKMSSTDFASNAVKLQIAMLAYNINNWFRRLCLPGKIRTNRMETLRNKLVKIAGKLVYSGRYWTWKLCSSCVYRKEFIQTLHNVNRIPKFT